MEEEEWIVLMQVLFYHIHALKVGRGEHLSLVGVLYIVLEAIL